MAVKTITIKEEAYNTLKLQKHENESFSDVILREIRKPLTINDIRGAVKFTKEEIGDFRRKVKQFRKDFDKDFEVRQKKIKERFK